MFSSGDSNSFTCTRRQRSSESQPLVSSVTLSPTHSRSANCTLGLCVASKAAILILLWNVSIGGIHSIGRDFMIFVFIVLFNYYNIDISFSIVAHYSLTAIIYLFYPLSGFLANVCFGRFNAIFESLTLFVCSALAVFLSVIICLLHIGIFQVILFLFCCFCLFIGMLTITSYKANSIQFGLDQLLEAPSQHQALFVHWAKWCYDLISTIVIAIIALFFCKFDINGVFVFKIPHFAPLSMAVIPIFLFFLIILLIIGWIKCH